MTVIATAEVYAGVVGLPITLTFKDETGAAINISTGQGTVVVKMRRPKGQAEVSYSGASVVLVGSGTTGICTVTTAATQLDKHGIHEVQGWFTRTSPAGVFPSESLRITVLESPTAAPV